MQTLLIVFMVHSKASTCQVSILQLYRSTRTVDLNVHVKIVWVKQNL